MEWAILEILYWVGLYTLGWIISLIIDAIEKMYKIYHDVYIFKTKKNVYIAFDSRFEHFLNDTVTLFFLWWLAIPFAILAVIFIYTKRLVVKIWKITFGRVTIPKFTITIPTFKSLISKLLVWYHKRKNPQQYI